MAQEATMTHYRLTDTEIASRLVTKPEYNHLLLIMRRAKDHGHTLTPILNRPIRKLIKTAISDGKKLHVIRTVTKIRHTSGGQGFGTVTVSLSQLKGHSSLIIIDLAGSQEPRFFIVKASLLRDKYSSKTTKEIARLYVPHVASSRPDPRALIRVLDHEDRWDHLV